MKISITKTRVFFFNGTFYPIKLGKNRESVLPSHGEVSVGIVYSRSHCKQCNTSHQTILFVFFESDCCMKHEVLSFTFMKMKIPYVHLCIYLTYPLEAAGTSMYYWKFSLKHKIPIYAIKVKRFVFKA